jgi:hypothetical protein
MTKKDDIEKSIKGRNASILVPWDDVIDTHLWDSGEKRAREITEIVNKLNVMNDKDEIPEITPADFQTFFVNPLKYGLLTLNDDVCFHTDFKTGEITRAEVLRSAYMLCHFDSLFMEPTDKLVPCKDETYVKKMEAIIDELQAVRVDPGTTWDNMLERETPIRAEYPLLVTQTTDEPKVFEYDKKYNVYSWAIYSSIKLIDDLRRGRQRKNNFVNVYLSEKYGDWLLKPTKEEGIFAGLYAINEEQYKFLYGKTSKNKGE